MKIFNKYVVIAISYACAMQLCGYIATEYLLDTRLSYVVLQPKLFIKTHFRACFNNHVTLHVIYKIDE